MSLRALAWDIDGTLIDSEPLHYRALMAGSGHFGVDLSDLAEDHFLGTHMGGVWDEVRQRFPAAVTFDTWLARINAYYIDARHELQPIDGALNAIQHASNVGLDQVCVSNSSRPIVDANIAALGLTPHIRFAISRNDVEKGKPDPEPYAQAAVRLDLEPRQMIAVEDSLTGAASARAAGMTVVGYRLPHHPSVDYTLSSYAELPAILERYL